MKKKFIFLAMMLLTLIGGGKILRAQETIEIGSNDVGHSSLPLNTYHYTSITQQIYTFDEIGQKGTINEISFYRNSGDIHNNRLVDIYMINTTKSSFTGPSDWVSLSPSDVVFSGTLNNGSATGWFSFTLDAPFEYTGDNLLICVNVKKNNNWSNNNQFAAYSTVDTRALNISSDGSGYDPTNMTASGNINSVINYIKLKVTPEVDDGLEPAVPTNLQAEALNHKSVSLTWDAAENALKYNVYRDDVKIGTTSETSYTVKSLSEETPYSFTVTGVRGSKESAHSTAASVTTLEYQDPFAGKQFRLQAQNYLFSSYGYYYEYEFTYPMHLNISSYDTDDQPYINVVAFDETEEQVFTFESTGARNEYYLRSASGYYIKCYQSNMGAPSTNVEDASILRVSYIDDDETTFNLVNKGSGEYIRVETIDWSNYKLYCDFTEQAKATKWVVEEVYLSVTATANKNNIYDDQITTLSANVMYAFGDVAYSWSLNGEEVGTESTYTFDPETTGEFTFTCTVTDAQNNEASATVTINVTERPALALTVNADAEKICNDDVTTLHAYALYGSENYTSYSWEPSTGLSDPTNANPVFTPTTVGTYTFTCTVTDSENATAEASVTIEVVENPFAGKQYRIKVNDGNYAGKYLNVNNYYGSGGTSTVGIVDYQESNMQIFTIKGSGYGQYYLKSADGYYVVCEIGSSWWGVHANSTTNKTPLEFEYTDNDRFYIKDYHKMTGYSQTGNNGDGFYFKVENNLVYCDAPEYYETQLHSYITTWTIEEVLPAGPQNLAVADGKSQLYPWETATLTWDAFEGATSYNIYVNGELKTNTAELTYELSELPYGNVEIAVAAAGAEGTDITAKARISVQVAGTFTLTVNVKDNEGNALQGATVSVTTDQWTYDEFGNNIESLEDVITDENGQAVFNNVLLLNPDTDSYYCSYYVSANMSMYNEGTTTPITNYENITNGQTVTREIVLSLPEPQNVAADKEYYIAGDDVVLTWDAPEFNTRAFLGYDVYQSMGYGEDVVKLNETVLTETTYTISDVEYGNHTFGVTAVYNEGVSPQSSVNVNVTGYGEITATVTDGTNPVAGVALTLIPSSGLGEEISKVTSADGTCTFEALVGTYTLTVSHCDYMEVSPVEGIVVEYQSPTTVDFTLTAKPIANITNVTATAEGDYANVSWTGDYAKYNVYRRPANTQDITTLQEGHTTTSYSDAEWATLEPGSYQYGVSTFVEQGGATRSEEYQINEGFENSPEPEGWEGNDHWYQGAGRNAESQYSSYGIYTGWVGYKHYLVTPMINTSGAVLSFYYWIDESYGAGDALDVYYSTESQSGSWSESIFNTTTSGGEWEYAEILLSDYISESQVYIAFCQTEDINGGGNGLMIDDVKVTSGAPAVTETETAIVWSDAIEKQGPNTFEGTLNAYWELAENWSHGAVPADGEDVVIAANAAIVDHHYNVANLTINNGVSLTVANNSSLTVTGKITQESTYSLILNEGGQIFQNNEGVTATFTKNFEKPSSWTNDNTEGWQFISMPLEGVSYTDFTTSEDADEEYDLYKYNASEDLEWQNYKENDFSETQFVSGTGYLAARKNATAVNFHGTLYNGTSWSKTLVSAYNDDSEIKNISLVGNPFTFNIKWSELYEASYSSYTDMYYVVNGYATVQDGEIAYSVEDEIKVGQGFMVKATAGYAGFSNFTPTKAAVATRSSRQSADVLNVIASGKAGKDNVVIRLAGESEGFPKLQNFNEDIANVYVANEGVRYGIVNVNEDVQEVELSFHAKEMGNYTINAIPSGEFESVVLVDKLTGAETNLLLEGYTFTATSNDNDNRFVIRLAVSGQQSANSNFVYQSGEDLIIDAEGTVQIIDVMGRIIFSDDVESTNGRVSVSDYKAGTYMVRVINGSEVKVEKVVIY